MRLLFGMILGAFLTVGAAYIYDTTSAGLGSRYDDPAAHGELGRSRRQLAHSQRPRPRRLEQAVEAHGRLIRAADGSFPEIGLRADP